MDDEKGAHSQMCQKQRTFPRPAAASGHDQPHRRRSAQHPAQKQQPTLHPPWQQHRQQDSRRAEKYDEAKRYGVRCDQIALILVLLTSALFIPLLPALLGQYHPTPEVLAMAKKLLYWSIPSLLLFWPRSNTLPSTLRAANDTLYPSVVSLAVLWIVTIGLGYVLAIPCKLGLLGVWIAMWASWAIRCVVFSVRFGSGKWLHKALTSR